MKKLFKVWTVIEVYDQETDEHEDLDPDVCQYKIFESRDLDEVATFIHSQSGNYTNKCEIENELKMGLRRLENE